MRKLVLAERSIFLGRSAAFQLAEQAKLRGQFLINLQRFGSGDIPAASAADLSLLDQKLNRS